VSVRFLAGACFSFSVAQELIFITFSQCYSLIIHCGLTGNSRLIGWVSCRWSIAPWRLPSVPPGIKPSTEHFQRNSPQMSGPVKSTHEFFAVTPYVLLIPYSVAQTIGGFIGAVIVYILFTPVIDHYKCGKPLDPSWWRRRRMFFYASGSCDHCAARLQ
jgi:hypothetical protein